MHVCNFNQYITVTESSCVTPMDTLRLHDDLLQAMPEGARHDSDVCPICVDKAQVEVSSTAGTPPAPGGPDDSTTTTSPTEGGTNKQMADMTTETHEALLQKAVADATAQASAEIASLKESNATLTTERDSLLTEKAALAEDNNRLNGELDTAQVSLKAATDEVATLKADIASKEEAAQKAEIASARATQVKNLGLFTDEYITEKASKWAEVDEAAWTERLEEWKTAKGDSAPETKKTETASVLEGTDEASKKTAEKPHGAKRAVLGLTA